MTDPDPCPDLCARLLAAQVFLETAEDGVTAAQEQLEDAIAIKIEAQGDLDLIEEQIAAEGCDCQELSSSSSSSSSDSTLSSTSSFSSSSFGSYSSYSSDSSFMSSSSSG